MCWISEELNKRVANCDITVYKVVISNTSSVMSLFRGFEYRFNKTYKESFIIRSYDSMYIITKGFHSYRTKSQVLYENQFYCMEIVKCILPKGTIYYINNFDEIVSNQIRIIGYEKI